MKRAKAADVDTIRDLNALSIELEHGVCINDEGMAMLEPGKLYCGVVTGISRDKKNVIVTWILATPAQVSAGEDLLVSEMSLPAERLKVLEDAAVNDETYELCVNHTRKWLHDLEEEEAFWQQGLAEIERLTGGDDSG
jgi:hypothetical protein